MAINDAHAFATKFLGPWNRHDIDEALEWFSPDAVWEFTVGSVPAGSAYHGRESIRAAIAEVFAAIPDISYELVRLHVGEGHLTMELRVRGTRDGQSLDYQACDIVELDDARRVVAKRSYRKVVS